MKDTKRLASLFLALVISTFLMAPAFASETKTIVDVDSSELIDYSDVLPVTPVHGEDFLGRWDDAEFDNSPTVMPNEIMPRSSSLLFSMKATNVQDLLVTGSEKEFARSDLTRDGLLITGTLKNSYSTSAIVRVGGCWYDSINDEFVKDGYREVEADGSIRVSIPKSEFVPDMMLRGFIKNVSGVGTISGYLYFYNSTL